MRKNRITFSIRTLLPCQPILACAIVLLLTFVAYGGSVNGRCFLEDRPCHYGIKVEIVDALFHGAKYTDCSGYYGPFIAVAPGEHTFRFSRLGYETVTLDYKVPIIGPVTLPDITLPSKGFGDPPLWEQYPYYVPGSDFEICEDDGIHPPTATYPIEWWYGNFCLTDEDGKEYGAFASFFKSPFVTPPHLLLFSISDLENEVEYSVPEYPLTLDASEHHLDLETAFLDQWYNKKCGSGNLIPFEHHLYVTGVDVDELGIVTLDLDMKSLKPPMPVSGDGHVQIGDGFSYYYSYTHFEVEGEIHVPGDLLSKDVHGYGWFDHQWGDFPVPMSDDIGWEWFSIQLDNNREIMVGDTWVDGVLDESYSGGLNLYNADCSLEVLQDYTITPLRFWTDAGSGQTFAVEWRIEVEEPTRKIALNVKAVFEDQVMELTPGPIFNGCFWEGLCEVNGTIGGKAGGGGIVTVRGTANAELTHSWSFILDVGDLVAGGSGVFDVTGGNANTTTYLACSIDGHGETSVPSLNLTLGLNAPFQIGAAKQTDGQGDASWTLNVPPAAAGMNVWFQSAQFENVSNVVISTID